MQNIRYSSCRRALPGETWVWLCLFFRSFFFIVYFDCLQALNHPFQLPLPSSMDFEFSLCHLHITLNQRILYVTVWSWNCKKSME